MSNAPNNKEQDRLIEQSKQQCSPGSARPGDFEVRKYAPLDTAYHGQRGNSRAEESSLLNERFQGRPQQPAAKRNVAGGR